MVLMSELLGGTVSGVMDSVGGFAAMVFHYNVGVLAHSERWVDFLGLLTFVSLCGFIALTYFQRLGVSREEYDKPLVLDNSSLGLGLEELFSLVNSGPPSGEGASVKKRYSHKNAIPGHRKIKLSDDGEAMLRAA